MEFYFNHHQDALGVPRGLLKITKSPLSRHQLLPTPEKHVFADLRQVPQVRVRPIRSDSCGWRRPTASLKTPLLGDLCVDPSAAFRLGPKCEALLHDWGDAACSKVAAAKPAAGAVRGLQGFMAAGFPVENDRWG